jgi:sterol 3beta-glucosyltransferase
MATTPTPRRGSLGGQDDAGLPHLGEMPLAMQRDDSTLTAELPEPLQGSDDDTSENVGFTQASPMAVNMNQSIFGLIAAAGSRVDFNTRFDDGSSDEDEDEGGGTGLKPLSSRHRDLSQTAIFGSLPAKDKSLGHKKKISGHRLLKSFASLPRRKTKSGIGSSRLWEPTQVVEEQSESSEPPSPKKSSQELEEEDLRIAPVMSRMLEAKAEMASRSSFDIDIERDSSGPDRTDEGEEEGEEEEEGGESHVTALANKLMEIFEFDEPERVIEGSSVLSLTCCLEITANNQPHIEYPCWLLKSVLLQGFLYITSKHICFYAYLPKKTVRLNPPLYTTQTILLKFTHDICSTPLPSLAIYQKAANATQHTIVTGFASKATYCRTTRIRQTYTFRTATLTSASAFLLASRIEKRKACTSQW